MKPTLVFCYGVFNYVLFLGVFLYLIAFVFGAGVPTSVDVGMGSFGLIGNLALLALFAVQHTIMARLFFKRWLTGFIPQPMERSTYLLATDFVLILIFRFWSTTPGIVWAVETPWLRLTLYALSAVGWGTVLLSTFLINHFDLFGLRQVSFYLKGKEYESVPFKKLLFYRYIRHPLMLGFLIAFWSTPTMGLGHLTFALAMTFYILIGIGFEERKLVGFHGEEYEIYRKSTGKFFPKIAR